jgi:hypothetical protein
MEQAVAPQIKPARFFQCRFQNQPDSETGLFKVVFPKRFWESRLDYSPNPKEFL